jgi:murE/murF fusion protein
VITNISYAHIKNFKNIKQIALAKSEIIKNIKEGGNLILNADDAFHDLHKKIASKKNIKVCSFSLKNKNSQIYLESIKRYKTKYKVCVNVLDFKKYFYLNSNFENDIKNLLAAISVISIFENISDLDINIFYNNKTPSGRGDISKVKILNKSFYLIDESYNSNPLSLNSALKNFQKIEIKNKKKHLLLGDMLELGSHSKKLHEEICKKINQTSIQNVNVIGKHMSNIFKNLNKKKRGLILKDKFEIINLIKNNINNNDYLMIKGSNSTGLNIIANNLKKGNINAL